LADIPIFSAISLTVKNSLPFTIITLFIGGYIGKHNKYTRKVEISKQIFTKRRRKFEKIP
jgi:hypothetical protein